MRLWYYYIYDNRRLHGWRRYIFPIFAWQILDPTNWVKYSLHRKKKKKWIGSNCSRKYKRRLQPRKVLLYLQHMMVQILLFFFFYEYRGPNSLNKILLDLECALELDWTLVLLLSTIFFLKIYLKNRVRRTIYQ